MNTDTIADFEKLGEPKYFIDHRKKSVEKIKETTLPSYQYGLSILIKPKTDFAQVITKPKPTVEFTIDADESIKIVHSDSMQEGFEEFLGDSWMSEDDDHSLYHYHESFANDFILITIPKNSSIEKPIHITQNLSETTLSNIFILAEPNAQARIIFHKTGKDFSDNSLISDHVKILAKQNSNIEFVSIQDLGNVANMQSRVSQTQKNAKVNWIDLCLGSDYTKSDIISKLRDEGAESNIKVLFAAKDKQKYDIYTASLHESKNTYSDIVTKGVVNDSAKGLSRGLVQINQESPGSNGYEQQDCLILSESAEADAIPNLVIHNHDVKCSHGSTVGQVDSEQVFYLQSRGLSEKEAKQKIVEGYFTPVLDLFSDEKIKTRIHQSILNSLEE